MKETLVLTHVAFADQANKPVKGHSGPGEPEDSCGWRIAALGEDGTVSQLKYV